MSHNKISVAILGNGKSLKKALITNILGKDISELSKTKILKNTKIYENETYVFTCMPDIPCDDIQEVFAKNPNPDMCLLVVKDGFSVEHVWDQIEYLSKKTKKPTEEFTVVLPLRHESTDYPFISLTMEQLLRELAYDHIRNIRPADNPKSQNQKLYSDFHSVTAGIDPSASASLKYLSESRRDGWMEGRHTGTTVNLVLLGMSGTGKSASGNTILRKKYFVCKPSSTPVTTECQVAETDINGIHIRVIDTPDIFDDDITPSVRDKHVKRCKQLCESEHCVYVLVMQVSRFADGEREVMKKLEEAFGSKVLEQTIILFTRGDDLFREGMTLENFLHSCQPGMKEIIQKCGNRCVLFENSRSSSNQVQKLINTASVMQEQQK